LLIEKRKAMKTKNESENRSAVKFILIVPVILIAFLAMYSCSNTSNRDDTLTSVAPPPPPPPTPMGPDADSVYVNVDELPLFTGGDTALLHWVGKHTKYPEEAKRNYITGKVLVRFVVEKDGSVSKPAIVEGVNPLLDAEALRVTGSLPKFEKPAIVNGKPVAVHFMLPISFRLN
jgi:TonB family protein